MGIYFNGKNHKGVYLGEVSHSALYRGSNLVWKKDSTAPVNLFDSTVADIDGYMRYADHKFNFTEGSTDYSSNAVTYFEAEPSTTYTVTMNMDTRFRLWSYAGMPTSSGLVIANYAIHATDDNTSTSQSGASKTLTITTASTDTRVFIGYWSKGGSVARLDVRNSITAVVGG